MNWHDLGLMQVQNIILAVSALISVILTITLIYTTRKLGTSQNKLQKEVSSISNDVQKQVSAENIAFQDKISNDNLRTTLYKYRIDCYLIIVEVLYNFTLNKQHKFKIMSVERSNLDVMYELEKDRLLFIKSYQELHFLFGKEVSDEISKILDIYHECLDIIPKLFIFPSDDFTGFINKKRKSMSNSKDVFDYVNNDESKTELSTMFPEFKKYIEYSDILGNFLKSDEFHNLFIGYIDVKYLGKIKI